jgi:hypothetical protein
MDEAAALMAIAMVDARTSQRGMLVREVMFLLLRRECPIRL